MDLKIKDFATMQGVSESIIYRHIRQHKEALGDRVVKRGNATWLTDEGQEYIRGLMTQQPIVVGDAETHRKVEDLEQENRDLLKALNLAKDRIIELQGAQARLEAAESTQKILEESRDEYKAQAEKNAQKASDEAQKAMEAIQEAERLRLQLQEAEAREMALKNRSWWGRLTRKGE